ncbi:amino acid regulated cytosolic protein [Roseibacterium elongatum DSM 19469]|uniref:Amino acid regulated cytosolic protein n=1 Tax=Roseicyclus elongatus DSM 19469 TaxID=1294273 RepID=W8S1T6_9RHOB|nr:YcjX family protein [Roseibacterium elongatum]AHM04142.1 amino acid regulated cytosolic protein [Roseibacterium elongatum DSM 19469]
MVIGRVADGLGRGVEGVTQAVSEAFFEPVIRLGVTGLARSGKTVFITSLVANLLDRGRMPGLEAAHSGRIEAAYLQPQPDDTVPRFAYEDHLAAMTGPAPYWPDSTRSVSELRLSLRVRPTGLLGGVTGPRTVHLDIVDYPGEWLLDLALLDQDFETWSQAALASARARPEGAAYAALIDRTDTAAKLEEPTAAALARAWTDYLTAARDAGYSDCTPGRFLLPGDLEGSPALTFAPLPAGDSPRGSLAREFARRFDAYTAQVVKPFFRNHFARIDRQIVLVDALGAIHAGPPALEDLRRALAGILGAFRPGRNTFLTAILGKRVDKILFAATKADHLHHEHHPRLAAIMEALVAEARRRADFSGAETQAMAIAALRATVEETRRVRGEDLGVVRGVLEATGKQAALHPGDLPADPAALLAPARDGAQTWLDGDYGVMRFAPAPLSLRAGEGPPHIRLDRAAEFLLGDRLR